jgi:cytochrome P450
VLTSVVLCGVASFALLQYETTANTLAFSLFCLATHPEAEAQVVAEIRAAAEAEAAAQAAAAAAGTKHEPWYTRNLEEQVGCRTRAQVVRPVSLPCCSVTDLLQVEYKA